MASENSNTIDINALMSASADDAVNFSLENADIQLDYSIKSVASLDPLLESLASEALDDKQLFTLSYMFGAYLGEVFIRNIGGNWLLIEEDGNEPPQVFVEFNADRIAFPGKIFHLLQGIASESIAEYFLSLTQRYL